MQNRPTGAARSRTVREDWFARLPAEMDELFDATRRELESSNFILSIAVDETIPPCNLGQYTIARERAAVLVELFDHLAIRLLFVIRTIEEHGARFGTLPIVQPLSPSNFRGATAQRAALMNNLLDKVIFRAKTRFLLKLHSLREIIGELRSESRRLVARISSGSSRDGDFIPRPRDESGSRRQENDSSPLQEASELPPRLGLSGFFLEVSESPRMKFGIAWVSVGLLVVPLAAFVAAGMSERAALLVLLAAILPLQYAIFVASNRFMGAPPRTVKREGIKSLEGSQPKVSFEANSLDEIELSFRELEVLAYDLNTCMGETTIILKSFFCALPEQELESFRKELIVPLPDTGKEEKRQDHSPRRNREKRFLTPEEIVGIREGRFS